MAEKEYKTLKEFWPFYLGEHASATNRTLHAIGSSFGLVWLGIAIYTGNYWLILAGLATGYLFAWVGHFLIEKNRPATFKYPFYSFACDWVMLFYVLTGQIGNQIAKYQIQPK